MITDTHVHVTCSGHNKKVLKELEEKLGFKWVYRKIITLPIEFTPLNCSSYVNVQCDYCAEEGITTMFKRKFSDCIKSRNINEKDACEKHTNLKARESREITYNKKYSATNRRIHKQRASISDIKNKLEDLDFKLREKEFNGDNSKIPYFCILFPDMPTKYVRIDRLNKGCICNYCKKCTNKKKKHWVDKKEQSICLSKRTLNEYLRTELSPWRYKSLEAYGNKCVVTGETENLEVHHVIPLKCIIKIALSNLGMDYKNTCNQYTKEEIFLIRDEVFKLHNEMWLGIPLCKSIHTEFHSKYNNESTIKSDLIKFLKDQYDVSLELKKEEIEFYRDKNDYRSCFKEEDINDYFDTDKKISEFYDYEEVCELINDISKHLLKNNKDMNDEY